MTEHVVVSSYVKFEEVRWIFTPMNLGLGYLYELGRDGRRRELQARSNGKGGKEAESTRLKTKEVEWKSYPLSPLL